MPAPRHFATHLDRYSLNLRLEISGTQTPGFRRKQELRFCVLLAADAEAREEYVTRDPYTGSLIISNVPKLHTLRAKVPPSADWPRDESSG